MKCAAIASHVERAHVSNADARGTRDTNAVLTQFYGQNIILADGISAADDSGTATSIRRPFSATRLLIWEAER
jgi:hypothetical protein